MVEENAHFVIAAAGVAKRVLHSGNTACRGAGEVIGAHGKADATLELHLVVVVHAGRPALATVDGETTILLVTTVNDIAAHEVGHGLLGGGPEFVLGSFGGLEHHVTMTVGVQLASRLGGGLDVVTVLLVDLGNVGDGSGPLRLDLEDLCFSHRGKADVRSRSKRDRGMVEENAHFVIAAAGVAKRNEMK